MWQGQPFLRIAIPFIAGIGAGSAFAEKLDAYVLLCVCGAVLSLLFFLRKEKDGEHSPWFGIGACLLSFCIGMTLYPRQHQNIESGARLLTTHCQGTLQAKPENKQHSYALRIRQHDGTEVILYVGKSKNHSSDSVSLSSLNIGDTIYAAVSHLNITQAHSKPTTAIFSETASAPPPTSKATDGERKGGVPTLHLKSTSPNCLTAFRRHSTTSTTSKASTAMQEPSSRP